VFEPTGNILLAKAKTRYYAMREQSETAMASDKQVETDASIRTD
jgi:hypothetical protein